MKIAIDISQIVYGTGVSYYTKKLIKNILLLDTTNEYILFGGSLRRGAEIKKIAQEIIGESQNVTVKVFPFPPRLLHLLWNKLHVLPVETLVGKVDVYHSSDWAQAPSKAFKVTTIHDLAPIFHPRMASKKIVAVHKARIKRIYSEVDRIIVPSTYSQNELLRLGFEAHKIVVIPEAVDLEDCKLASVKALNKLKHKYHINGKYIMTVGAGERKNTSNLIKAFELSRAGKNLSLIIAGESVVRYGAPRAVRFIGHIEDSELFTLYTGAEAMVYPSFYEGFGLPILQAFACKCPVVTSNVSSMPEVAGEGAILVDPNSVSAIAEGISRALETKKTLIGKGLKQIEKFSWEKTAQMTIDLYKEVKK